MKTIATMIEHIFTTAHPETGGEPPAHICWAIFERDTFFISGIQDLEFGATAEEIKAEAIKNIKELGIPITGSPSADFTVTKLDWYPEDNIYLVTYDNPTLMNIVDGEDEDEESWAIGLVGRGMRSADAEAPKILQVRTFEGEITHF